MLKLKRLYITIAVLSAIVFYFFYMFTHELEQNYNKTNKELIGLSKLKTLAIITDALQQYRGIESLSYGSVSDKNYALQRRYELHRKILMHLPALENPKTAKQIETILAEKSKKPVEIFSQLTTIINTLNDQIFDIADKYDLLYEADKTNYLLMHTLVFIAPDIKENAAKLHGIATRAKTQIKTFDDAVMIDNIRYQFEQKFGTLTSTTFILQENNLALQNSATTIERTYQNYSQLLEENSTHSALKYFYDGSRLVEAINAFSNIAHSEFRINLKNRAVSLRNIIIINYAAFLITIFSTIALITYFHRRAKELLNNDKKEKNYHALLEKLQFNLLKNDTFKEICDESMSFIANYFHAVTGVFYLYNPKNNQLELSATYGIDNHSLTHTLQIGEGLIGQNFLENRIIEMYVEEFTKESIVKMGAINAKVKKVVTLPLQNFNTVIGVYQIVLTEDTAIDYPFLKKFSEIIANFVQKAIQHEESQKYLVEIDKNVITSSTNAKGIITEVSEAFAIISGYRKEELLGKKHSIIHHPDMPNELFKDLWKTITKGNVWKGEVKNRTKDGGFYWVDVIITPNFNLYGKIVGYTAIRHDITNKKKLEVIAITDGLTQIFNRRHFDDIFPLKLKEAHREKKNLVFVLIDIDHFKQFNDTYGHQEGDYALISVADTLKILLKRPGDFVFRLGGEEFGLLYDANSAEEAEVFALLVKDAVESLNIPHKNNSASSYVTISMGLIFISSETSQTVDYLYKSADNMLYSAKESGRNTVKMKIVD
jgi:diguanylate cyclase (GGDEF)-like protein/PAS domain S-box-containing protein